MEKQNGGGGRVLQEEAATNLHTFCHGHIKILCAFWRYLLDVYGMKKHTGYFWAINCFHISLGKFVLLGLVTRVLATTGKDEGHGKSREDELTYACNFCHALTL